MGQLKNAKRMEQVLPVLAPTNSKDFHVFEAPVRVYDFDASVSFPI
jgi:hypothetical protein